VRLPGPVGSATVAVAGRESVPLVRDLHAQPLGGGRDGEEGGHGRVQESQHASWLPRVGLPAPARRDRAYATAGGAVHGRHVERAHR
jgi:hypothetical protein